MNSFFWYFWCIASKVCKDIVFMCLFMLCQDRKNSGLRWQWWYWGLAGVAEVVCGPIEKGKVPVCTHNSILRNQQQFYGRPKMSSPHTFEGFLCQTKLCFDFFTWVQARALWQFCMQKYSAIKITQVLLKNKGCQREGGSCTWALIVSASLTRQPLHYVKAWCVLWACWSMVLACI